MRNIYPLSVYDEVFVFLAESFRNTSLYNSTLGADSAEDKLMRISLFFPENRI